MLAVRELVKSEKVETVEGIVAKLPTNPYAVDKEDMAALTDEMSEGVLT